MFNIRPTNDPYGILDRLLCFALRKKQSNKQALENIKYGKNGISEWWPHFLTTFNPDFFLIGA